MKKEQQQVIKVTTGVKEKMKHREQNSPTRVAFAATLLT